MKKIILRVIIVVLLLIIIGGLLYFFGIFGNKNRISGDTKIEFPGRNLVISVGNSFHVDYYAYNVINNNIRLQKIDDGIIELDENGNMRALKEGKTIVNAIYNDIVYDTLNIYVLERNIQTSYVPLTEDISLSFDSIELKINEEKEINYDLLPKSTNNNLCFLKSENEDIVQIMDSKIKGVGVGKTNISIESFDGLKKSISVNVLGIDVSNLVVEDNISLKLSEVRIINYQVVPSDATNKKVVFTSSNPAIVSVSDTGELKAVSTGNAIITVATEDGKITKTINVTVTNNSNNSNNNNNNNSNNNNNNNSNVIGTSACKSTDPSDIEFMSCFSKSHGLVLSSSNLSIKAGSSGSVTVSLPSECGTNTGYTRKSADGEAGWRDYVTQSRSNETNTGFTWIVNAKESAKGKQIILSQTIQYNAISKGGCTGNVKSMARLYVTVY